MNKSPHRKGFSLIEMLVVVGIFAVVSVALNSMISYVVRTNAETIRSLSVSGNEMHIAENMIRVVRESGYGDDGGYPIQDAGTLSLTLYEDENDDGSMERVHYTVSNASLTKSVQTSSGIPPVYGAKNTMVLLENVQNDENHPLFTYYDRSGNELSEPIDVRRVARVVIVISTGETMANAVFHNAGAATLRNVIPEE